MSVRVPLNLKIGEKGKQKISDTAHGHHATMSEVVRAAIAVAFRHPEELSRTIKSLKEQQ